MENRQTIENSLPTVEDRAIGAFLGLAVGDALGATVEFMTPAQIQRVYGTHRHIIGGGWLALTAGEITDDTQMSLALGRAIIAKGEIDEQSIAESFSNWLSTEPVDIGNTVKQGIVHYRYSGKAESPYSELSAGNGACMRTLPLALFTLGKEEQDIRELSRRQAHITHNNVLSDAGTECVIHMLHIALGGCVEKHQFMRPVDYLYGQYTDFRCKSSRRLNPSPYIVDTLQAVFQAVDEESCFEETLVNVVNRGGDADTTGAIAGMLAGAFYGRADIPEAWISTLDPTIKNECTSQAIQILGLA